MLANIAASCVSNVGESRSIVFCAHCAAPPVGDISANRTTGWKDGVSVLLAVAVAGRVVGVAGRRVSVGACCVIPGGVTSGEIVGPTGFAHPAKTNSAIISPAATRDGSGIRCGKPR